MAPAHKIVRTTQAGPVEGYESQGTWVWRGIPYASVAKERYQPPQPPVPWRADKPLSCKKFGPSAIQAKGADPPNIPRGDEENCLNLNISIPKDTPAGAKLPVLVWIHGGGFIGGGSGDTLVDPTVLVREHKLCYVSINYRMHILGMQSLTRFNTDKYTFHVNCGMKDQVAALQWVHDNIHEFGGDSGNVTLVGESAGASSVLAHYCIKGTEHLWHRGFAMSVAGNAISSQAQQHYWAGKLVELLGVDPNDKEAAAEALMTRPVADLAAAAGKLSIEILPKEYPGFFVFGPVIEPGTADYGIVDAFQTGNQHKKPLVMTSQEREGLLFYLILPIVPVLRAGVLRLLENTMSQQQKARLLKAYNLEKEPRVASCDIGADSVFWHSSVLIGEAHAKCGQPVWCQVNHYVPPVLKRLGIKATHALNDVWLYHGLVDRGVGWVLTLGGWWGRKGAQAVSDRFQSHLVNFAKSGRPVESDKVWPQYDTTTRPTLVSTEEKDEIVSDYQKEKREAWGDWRSYKDYIFT